MKNYALINRAISTASYKQVRENIISNNKFFLIEKNNKVSFIFIEKIVTN